MPHFTWVIRDADELQLVNPQGNPITSNEYLELSLAERDGVTDDVFHRNLIRKVLKKCFKHRNCFTLIRPVDSAKLMKELDKLEWDKLDQDFKD